MAGKAGALYRARAAMRDGLAQPVQRDGHAAGRRAGGAERIEVVCVIEPERAILGDADPEVGGDRRGRSVRSIRRAACRRRIG